MRRAQVDDTSDTRPFHVDAKGRGGQTMGDEACHLLYMYICEDCNNNLGHDDAREKLESKGV